MFKTTRTLPLPELQATLVELTHEPTGAEVIHLECDDDENFFCLSFRTWPSTSNGVAHILEHTVLCGSDKYPIKDPFFGMTRRSLNTFMNAFTGPDFTCYPAASQVPKDFYNLLEVYLDAVFHPRLLEKSFLQEGHRLEYEEDKLEYKGIVFNEMKGSLSSPDTRLCEAVMEATFPDLTYGINSGGDPKEIPNLTYEELKAFHAKFYHPSRCLFFFYGNLPLEKHLDFIEKHTLSKATKEAPLPPLPKQPRFTKPQHQTLTYPVAEKKEENTMVGITWLTLSILEQEDLLALTVIDLVLTATDASPLKMAFLKSGLCKQVDTMLDGELSEVPLTLICKGCPDDAGDKIEKLALDTFAKVAEEGLSADLVEGAIHQLELSRSEISGGSSPFGLSLFFRSALLKQQGGNPEDGLLIHTLFNHLRERVKDPTYLPGLIRQHFLDNPHRTTVVMHPDTELAAHELAEEEARLKAIDEKLSAEEKEKIVHQAAALEAFQEEEDAFDVLPCVTLDDVTKEAKEFPLVEEKIGALKVFHHTCFTNDLVYADLVYPLAGVVEEELPYVRLFTLLLTQVGCGGRDYKEHLDYMLQHTGGLGTSLDLNLQAEDPTLMHPTLSIRGKALHYKIDKLFPLMRSLVTTSDFTDKERIKELLMQHYHGLENSIQQSPLRYAINLSARGLSVPAKIVNAWYGLDYFWWLKEIVATFDENPEELIEKMEEMKGRFLDLKGAELVLACDERALEEIRKNEVYGLALSEGKSHFPWSSDFPLEETPSQGRLTSSPVAFTSFMFGSVPYIDPDAAILSVASEIMENRILHKRIREQGGAYGSGAVNGTISGNFYFYAYRDPHLGSTLDAFKESIEKMVAADFTASDLEEAKLGMIQSLDSPTAPASRAITAYSRRRTGRSHARRQAFRDQILKTTKQDIQEAAKRVLVPGSEKGVTVTFGGKELLEKENETLKERLPLLNV